MSHNQNLAYIGKHVFGGLHNLEEIKLSNNEVLTVIEPYAFTTVTSDNENGFTWLEIKKVRMTKSIKLVSKKS